MSCDGPESGDEHVNGMDDNLLAKIAKNGKPNTWTASRTLVRELDVTGEHWIKYMILQADEEEEEKEEEEECGRDVRVKGMEI